MSSTNATTSHTRPNSLSPDAALDADEEARPDAATARRPFVPPRLRHEKRLTELTRDQVVIWSSGS